MNRGFERDPELRRAACRSGIERHLRAHRSHGRLPGEHRFDAIIEEQQRKAIV